jgi:hypothetical protein
VPISCEKNGDLLVNQIVINLSALIAAFGVEIARFVSENVL